MFLRCSSNVFPSGHIYLNYLQAFLRLKLITLLSICSSTNLVLVDLELVLSNASLSNQLKLSEKNCVSQVYLIF